jgi:hypothetical protein
MLKRFKILLALTSLMGLFAFGGCVAETGDIEGNAQGGDRTEVNAGSLTVGLNIVADIELDPSEFELILVADDGEEITAVFEEESDGRFVVLVEELDPEKSWTLNVEGPDDVEISQPSQEVTIVAGEMKNVDIEVTNVQTTE